MKQAWQDATKGDESQISEANIAWRVPYGVVRSSIFRVEYYHKLMTLNPFGVLSRLSFTSAGFTGGY